jgi:hypothetical protein
MATLTATLADLHIQRIFTSWLGSAIAHYIFGLILVEHGASCLRSSRYLPDVSHDRLHRLLSVRHLAAWLMLLLRCLAASLPPAVWIIDDVIVPKPASQTLAWAKSLWCPAEQRYVHGINIVVLLACWGPIRIPLGFRLWCPKEKARGGHYRTKLDLARTLIAEARASGLACQYVVFDSWYASGKLTRYLNQCGLIWHTALACNHMIVWQEQIQRVDALGRQIHDWYARRIALSVASASVYSPELGQVRLTRVAIGQRQRPYLYLVTNDLTCTPSQAWACKQSRWPIEPLFRDEKQLLALAGCQSSSVRAQINHIALVLVAWVVLQRLRQAPSQTTGEVQEELIRTIWGHDTRFSASVSDFAQRISQAKAA